MDRTKSSGKLLTKKEFALELGVSEALVNKWLRLGKIRVIRLSRCVRISREELSRVTAGGLR